MLRKLSAGAAMGVLCLFASAAVAQTAPQTETTPAAPAPVEQPAPAQPAAPPAAAPNTSVVPNGTPIVVEIVNLVTTRTAMRDDMFDLKLAEPVMLNGTAVIPAGTPGKGQVVDASKPGMGGKPGKLVLAGRYLDLNGRKVPIKALNLNLTSRDASGQAVAVGMAVGIIGLAVQGGQMEVPPGTKGHAKLSGDFNPDAPAPAATPQDAAPAAPQEGATQPAQPTTDAAPAAATQSNP